MRAACLSARLFERTKGSFAKTNQIRVFERSDGTTRIGPSLHLGSGTAFSARVERTKVSFTKTHIRVTQESDGTARIGPSAHLGSGIGDVTEVRLTEPLGSRVAALKPLVQLEWEGYKQSEGDELYHTIWETLSGTEVLALPFPAKVLAVNPEALTSPATLCFDQYHIDWLFHIDGVDEEHLLSCAEYKAFIASEEASISAENAQAGLPGS